ncbi:MAG: hypothetical protein DRQ01_00825 [Ignavibacteriae bacterium]|nr:MAG: hypothetical protein DRQ01_00825 [Ignavibacteriota bacterium]
MKWEKLSPNRWRCQYYLQGKFSTRTIICDIYRRGKNKVCTWNIRYTHSNIKLWSGKIRGVQHAKDEIGARILEAKICSGVE